MNETIIINIDQSEILFFKIYRSIVIRNIIFGFIKGTGLNYNKIKSALWMCNNNHYGLFKDKLQQKQNILYDSESHVKLPGLIKDLSIYKQYINDSKVANHLGEIPFVDYAASFGKLEFIKYLKLIDEKSDSIPHAFFNLKSIENACLSGSLECVQYLEELVSDCTSLALDNASMKGHLHIVKYLVENRSEGGDKALSLAIENGHLEVVQYLTANKYVLDLETTSDSWDLAAKNGYYHMVKYLHENRNEGFSMFAINHASMNGHIEVVKYLLENRKDGCTEAALNLAAKNNHTKLCQLLIAKGVPGNDNCISNAAKAGNLELVEWIHKNSSYRVSANTFSNICLDGDLEMVKLLCRLGTQCTSAAWEKASQNGHLKIIHYLHYHNPQCKSSAQAANLASLHGHFNTLLFLIKYRPETNLQTALQFAKSLKHEKIINLLNSIIIDPTIINSYEI